MKFPSSAGSFNRRGASILITQRWQNSGQDQFNLIAIQEVADWAKVSTKTVYPWISDHKFPAVRLGKRTYRISEKAIIVYPKQIESGFF